MSMEIFVGSLIEYGSDRAILERVVSALKGRNEQAIVLANINLGGRQIDLVVALKHLTLVIEAKGYSAPVRGAENGVWQYRMPSGGWRNFPISNSNPYVQTVQASYALRDAMARHVAAEVAYPSAALVFTPSIPPASSIPKGDFKAAVVGLEAIDVQLQRVDQTQWTFEQWRTFAKSHQFISVETISAAFDPEVIAAEELIATYTKAFQRTYQPLVAEIVPFDCRRAGDSIASTVVLAGGPNGWNFLLSGASGCGKTLLAYQIGIDSIGRGQVPVFFRAKDFLGNFRDTVNQEVALLDSPSIESLLTACRRLSRSPFLIIDGYNECADLLREKLTRSVAAASRRFKTGLLITTQIPLQNAELIDLDAITILPPEMVVKRAIAAKVSEEVSSDSSFDALLDSVDSGLEARLIGEVGRSMASDASRYAIFDQFVRKRLSWQAGDGISALAGIAGLLSDRLSFGLSIRDLERHAERERVPHQLLRELCDAKLLVQRADRVSFGHELFLNAFSAETIVRRANGNPSFVASALRLPQHSKCRTLIIGAIDDEEFLEAVLKCVVDSEVIQSCLAGECGGFARRWAETQQKLTSARVREEIARTEFEIRENDSVEIHVKQQSLFAWTREDEAMIGSLPMFPNRTHDLESILELAAITDQRLAEEHRRLSGQAERLKIALRSALFQKCYVWRYGPAAAKVLASIHSGAFAWKCSYELAVLIRQQLSRDDLSPGQLYILITLYRRAESHEWSLASLLPKILRGYWRWAPYHLRLELLDAAHFSAWKTTEEERHSLVLALEELPPPKHWALSGTLLDALKALGALDSSEAEHTEVVRSNIRDALADSSDPDMQEVAFGVWYGQFDHPYDGAYCEAISELAPAERKTLLTMAAQGASQDSAFVMVLILELAALADPTLGRLIARWTALPPRQCVFRQEAIGAFARSHITLARLGCPLSEVEETLTDEGRALMACGHILYWLNRVDLPATQRRIECMKIMPVLMNHENNLSTSVLSEFSMRNSIWTGGLRELDGPESVHASIEAAFPAEVSEICRHCLQNPEKQRGYFDWIDRHDVLRFAIDVLRVHGTTNDIGLLRCWSRDSDIGKRAVEAIAWLEEGRVSTTK